MYAAKRLDMGITHPKSKAHVQVHPHKNENLARSIVVAKTGYGINFGYSQPESSSQKNDQ